MAERDLKREIDDLRERFHTLQDHELFIVWFLRAFVTEDDMVARDALTGESGDKSNDAILVNDDAKKVFLVQGKYHKSIGSTTESRSDITAFAQLAPDMVNQEAFDDLRQGLAPKVQEMLTVARKRIMDRGYRLQLHYVTTGKCSKGLRNEAEKIVRRADANAAIDIFDGKQVLVMLGDYLDGVAPPVPALDLEMESGRGVVVKEILHRYDCKTHIDSWVFSMTNDAVAGLYEQAGPRLFARNVRGYLGNTEINESMKETLENEPEFFWYYNNGVTIVCDEAQRTSRGGLDVLHVKNPQVINGQQTTRILHANLGSGHHASVIVRVISVPRKSDDVSDHFETLVSSIVAATNLQNAIRPSDLMSNDRRQVELERHLRNLGYYYMRKRQTKGEARLRGFGRHQVFIRKEELAQAVAACELDPWIVREGKEGLFEERLYPQVFPNDNPRFYLARYWLLKAAEKAAKGYPERAYAKWLVIHFMWRRLSPELKTKAKSERFRVLNELYDWDESLLRALIRAIDAAFKSAMQFFRAHRGKGPTAIDVSSFFKRKGLHDELETFWRSSLNGHRASFNTAWHRFQTLFLNECEE
ncbi:MAG: AIPR family protein [Thermoguttaceae bacterium]